MHTPEKKFIDSNRLSIEYLEWQPDAARSVVLAACFAGRCVLAGGVVEWSVVVGSSIERRVVEVVSEGGLVGCDGVGCEIQGLHECGLGGRRAGPCGGIWYWKALECSESRLEMTFGEDAV